MKSYIEKIKEIQDELKWDSELFESDVHIEMKDDIVTLSGTVENEQKKKTAETVASKVEGVRSVINNLKVSNNINNKQEGAEVVPSPNSGDPDNSLKVSGA